MLVYAMTWHEVEYISRTIIGVACLQKHFFLFFFGGSGSPLSLSLAGVATKNLAVIMTISVHFSQYILYVTKCARGIPLVHGTKKKFLL